LQSKPIASANPSFVQLVDETIGAFLPKPDAWARLRAGKNKMAAGIQRPSEFGSPQWKLFATFFW